MWTCGESLACYTLLLVGAPVPAVYGLARYRYQASRPYHTRQEDERHHLNYTRAMVDWENSNFSGFKHDCVQRDKDSTGRRTSEDFSTSSTSQSCTVCETLSSSP